MGAVFAASDAYLVSFWVLEYALPIFGTREQQSMCFPD
jgi:hypothetical protein